MTLEGRIGPSRLVFEVFGHAITTITWISFCTVGLAFLWRATLASGNSPQGIAAVLVGLMAAIGFGSCLLLVWHLWRIAREIQAYYEENSNKMIADWLKHLHDGPRVAFILLVLIVAALVSLQLLEAVRLL